MSIAWILCFSFLIFVQTGKQKELWEKLTLIIFAIIIVSLHIISLSRIKYFTLIDDVLVIRKIFSKPEEYSLKTVSGWTENQYELFGFKTTREIVLKLKGELKINLFKRNSKDFDKLSDYLNENFPETFEKDEIKNDYY